MVDFSTEEDASMALKAGFCVHEFRLLYILASKSLASSDDSCLNLASFGRDKAGEALCKVFTEE